jgi:O-acetyl-ADP-ribose deacetylase
MASIEIRQGDIAKFEAEALVNAANNYLWMGSGVAGALKMAGGREIEEEAVKKGPIAVGEVAVTGAGNLKANYVIHAVVMGQDLQTDAVIIETATANSLARAGELGLKSIVFPAFGTGVSGFSLAECARIMIGAVRQYSSTHPSPEKVIFALYDEPAYRIFKAELERQPE